MRTLAWLGAPACATGYREGGSPNKMEFNYPLEKTPRGKTDKTPPIGVTQKPFWEGVYKQPKESGRKI